MIEPLAPLVLFAYNRPEHLKKTVDHLRANDLAAQSSLTIFCDGPKVGSDPAPGQAVRDLAHAVKGFARVEVICRDFNFGLARSIIEGVSQLVEQHGRVIVLEDDLVTSPYFLRYMNEGLHLYANDPEVASIHGYVYPVGKKLPETFFIRGADCWGWATWARAWKEFQPQGALLLEELEKRNLVEAFDLDGAYRYTQMLRDQIAGKNNSWAIRWHASTFLANRLALYPGRSLVQNIGLDASGTHCGPTTQYDVSYAKKPIHLERLALQEDRLARQAFIHFFQNKKKSSFSVRLKKFFSKARRQFQSLWPG